MLRLGIAVTTYNRRQMVAELCARLRLLTQTPFNLVICDDGSTDGTVGTLLDLGETVIGGRNGGVARNKNRGIWFLMQQTASDVILLLDDDVVPQSRGWDLEWVAAALRHGHINHSIAGSIAESGQGNAGSPFLSRTLAGQAICFRRDVLAMLGYMDPRFKRYGNEHTELTLRAIRAGYGGEQNAAGENLFYGIRGGIAITPCTGNGTPEEIVESHAIMQAMAGDPVYRNAWRDDAECAAFLGQVQPLHQGAPGLE